MTNLLIAEDDKVIRKVIKKNLSSTEFNLFIAEDGVEALNILKKEIIHIAILDWMLPGIEGIEICREIRSDNTRDYTYIILLTSKIEQYDLIEGFSAGADDYIKKPFNSHELKARIKTGERIIDLQGELLATQEKLRIQATHDGLTNLLNRKSIIEILELEFERSSRVGSTFGVIMADVDHFKKINDNYGHQAGDMILKGVSETLESSLRIYDRVGRYGGEEFIIILPDCDESSIQTLSERLRLNISEREYKIGEKKVNVTISMGLTVMSHGSISSSYEMIQLADNALYKAKENGRDRFVLSEISETTLNRDQENFEHNITLRHHS